MTARAAIPCLFDRCRPSHVARFVITVVVTAIKRVVLGWSQADVCDEGFKRVSPGVADRNAAASVQRIFPVGRIVAALAEVSPAAVFGRFLGADPKPRGMAVRRLACASVRIFQTPARFHRALVQCRHVGNHCGSAIALAADTVVPITVRKQEISHRQAFESLTDGDWQGRSTHLFDFTLKAGA